MMPACLGGPAASGAALSASRIDGPLNYRCDSSNAIPWALGRIAGADAAAGLLEIH